MSETSLQQMVRDSLVAICNVAQAPAIKPVLPITSQATAVALQSVKDREYRITGARSRRRGPSVAFPVAYAPRSPESWEYELNLLAGQLPHHVLRSAIWKSTLSAASGKSSQESDAPTAPSKPGAHGGMEMFPLDGGQRYGWCLSYWQMFGNGTISPFLHYVELPASDSSIEMVTALLIHQQRIGYHAESNEFVYTSS